jgi:hypothetical protein
MQSAADRHGMPAGQTVETFWSEKTAVLAKHD